LLIDAHHKKWILVTFFLGAAALAFYSVVYYLTPGGLSGGSIIGLWYGIIGVGLMSYAALLSALRRVPGWWWLGARKTWLRGHIWLGSISGLFILCHSGFRWGGLLEAALWVVLLATLATGIFGLVLQQMLPRLITARITSEAPYDQIPRISAIMLQKAEQVVEGARQRTEVEPQFRERLESIFKDEVRPFLAGRRRALLMKPEGARALFAAAGLTTDLADEIAALEMFCRERSQLFEQERLYHWLHGWLLLHVPLSIALLGLTVVHIYMSLYY